MTIRSAASRLLAAVSFFFSVSAAATADVELTNACTAHFASANEGAEILGSKDPFVERLSPFDRAARLKTDRPVTTAEFLAFVRKNVVEWTDEERARLEAAIAKIRPSLEALKLPLPARVSFIKTTGAEEGNAFYTRDNAIVFPQGQLQKQDAPLERMIAHELFHILSRQNPTLREALYNAIGFTKCPEVALPPELAIRKITNPDAPANDHSIKLKSDGKDVTAVPILFSNRAIYDVDRGGEFFSYMEFGFLPLDGDKAAATAVIKTQDVTGFFEQVGRNTNYIIHPEEILAENFALIVQERADVPSPEVLQRIRTALTQAKAGAAKSR